MEDKTRSPFVRKDGSIRVEKPLSRSKHILYNSLGIVFLITGLVGVVLPVLPTTVFLILSSGFFIRSNPGLYRWLHNNRLTGSYLRVYTRGEGMSLKSKAWSIGILWFTLAVSGYFVRSSYWILAVLAVVGVSVSWHVATIRPRIISSQKLEAHRRIMNADTSDEVRGNAKPTKSAAAK